MGYAKRYALAVTLLMLLASAAAPALPQGPAGVDPPGVVLPGGGQNATIELEVVKDSVALSASLDLEGRPVATETVTPVSNDTTIGFMGSVDFVEPTPDLTHYYDDTLTADSLDALSTVDGHGVLTESTGFSYQLFVIDVTPEGLYNMSIAWTGRGNATVAATTYHGVTVHVYNNATAGWEALASYSDDVEADHTLVGGPLSAPWRYVNRTYTGDHKVIVLVISHRGTDSALFTDSFNVTTITLSYPRPRLDLGADGTVDWGFGTDPSTGHLGHVGHFDDGADEVPITFPPGGGYDDSAAVLIPKGAQVDAAYLDYVAFASKGERLGGGDDVTAGPSASSPDLVVSGIPLLSHQNSSSVLLTDVTKLNVSEQSQESLRTQPEYFYVGRGAFYPQSIAQTFTPQHDGPVTGVSIFISSVTGAPGNLTVELREAQAGQPTGSKLASKVMTRSDLTIDAWNFFPMTGVELRTGVKYAFVVMATDEPASPDNMYNLAYNGTMSYTRGEAFATTTFDGAGPWTSSGYSLAFRVKMDYAIGAQDARSLEVLGRSGTLSQGRVYFDVSDFDYEAGKWTFTVDNLNPFAVRFNWTARTTYLLFAEAPSLDVGADGTVEWVGDNVSTTAPLDITEGLNRVLAITDWPHVHMDQFGNTLVRVPFNLSVTSEGDVALRNVVVYYHGSVRTGDIAAHLNLKKRTLPADAEGLVRIPVNLTSSTLGQLNVTAFNVEYDLPPHSLEFRDITIPEDGEMVGGPLYLDTLIFDDHDNNELTYTVVREAGSENVSWNLTPTNVLTFSGPANWSGWSRFHIVAEDTLGLNYSTNPFNVTIEAVNDPPMVLGLVDVSPPFDRALGLEIQLVDNDSPPGSLTVSTDSPRVTFDAGNSTLVFLYPEGSTDETVHITASDGVDSSVYAINATPIVSDEPPTVLTLPIFSISIDGHGLLNLTPYATDLESDPEDLVWAVVDFPEQLVASMQGSSELQIIPVATTEGTHTMTLSVTDPDGNTVTAELTVELTSAQRHSPVILRGDDALPPLIKVKRGHKVVINLALQEYWYDQEDFNEPQAMTWEANSLRPNLFAVEIDKNNRLTIQAYETTGNGYMTLRLVDSDGDSSSTESVQVQVVEPKSEASSWTFYFVALILLLFVVAALVAASRSRGAVAAKPPKPAKPPGPEEPTPPAPGREERAPSPPAGPVDLEPEEPLEPARATIVGMMVIHESTSLMASISDKGTHALPEEKQDELIELATLFAQERFEDAKVGAIKAFKFEDYEVLVGKGMNYYIAARCTGNEFDDVVTEIKRSIINIDVNLGERLRKWYPGQRLQDVEEELRQVINGQRG